MGLFYDGKFFILQYRHSVIALECAYPFNIQSFGDILVFRYPSLEERLVLRSPNGICRRGGRAARNRSYRFERERICRGS